MTVLDLIIIGLAVVSLIILLGRYKISEYNIFGEYVFNSENVIKTMIKCIMLLYIMGVMMGIFILSLAYIFENNQEFFNYKIF